MLSPERRLGKRGEGHQSTDLPYLRSKSTGALNREIRGNMCKNKLISKVDLPTVRSEFQGALDSIAHHSTANPSGLYG